MGNYRHRARVSDVILLALLGLAMKATSAIKATSARGRCAFCPLVRRGVLVCGVLRCCCKVVSWTGVMGLRRAAYGVQLSWAYAPGELPGNFAEQQLLV